MNTSDKTHRLFFALWPSEQTRQAILDTCAQLPKSMKGRFIQPQNLHITLHFIGQVSEDVKDCMHIAAQTISGDVFAMNMDCLGHFPRAKILWMGCTETPAALTQLHKELGNVLAECDYQCERRPYAPHLTLLRKGLKSECQELVADQPHFSIPWKVNEFVLVESQTDQQGVIYQVIEQYSLS